MSSPLRKIRATDFYVTLLPVTVVTFLLATALTQFALKYFGRPPDFSEMLSTFRNYLVPKPDQQLRYVLLLILWPTLWALATLALSYWRRKTKLAIRGPVLRGLILASKIAIPSFILWNLIFHNRSIQSFLPASEKELPGSLLAFACALAVTGLVLYSPSNSERRPKLWEGISAAIALLLSLVELLTCVIPESGFSGMPSGVFFHLPFTFDEFAAVANGHTLSVDFYPQYQQLLPYLFSPLFSIFGLSITTYTVGFAFLSGLVLAFSYAILRRVSDHPKVTLLLFLSWLGVAFFPLETEGAGRFHTFTYFPVGPLRYIGFWSVAYFTTRTASGELTFRNQFLCLFLATLAAFNTFDFGIPTLIASLAVITLFSPSWKRTALAFLCAFATSLLISVSIPLIRSGSLPDIGASFSYLVSAGRAGYTSLRTPDWGAHWILLLGLLCSLAFGLGRWWNAKRTSQAGHRERSLTAGLIFFGLAGCGAFSYFMNRSHWHILVMIAPVAFFPFLLYATALFERSPLPGLRHRLQRIPRILCLLAIALELALLKDLPNPINQWERIQSVDARHSVRENAILDLIRKFSSPSEKVAICYPLSQLLARRADVVNIFPYPQGRSLLIRAQMETALRAVTENGIRTIYGEFPAEFYPWLSENGFQRVGNHEDFAVYQKVQ